jgi:hypothetical protein
MKKNWQKIKEQNKMRVYREAIGISLGGGEDDTLYRSFTIYQRRVSISQGSGHGSAAQQPDDDRYYGDFI